MGVDEDAMVGGRTCTSPARCESTRLLKEIGGAQSCVRKRRKKAEKGYAQGIKARIKKMSSKLGPELVGWDLEDA